MAKPQYQWPKGLRQRILLRDGHRCQIKGPRCTGTASHVDHIIPISENGVWWDPGNLRAACATCNLGRTRRVARASRSW